VNLRLRTALLATVFLATLLFAAFAVGQAASSVRGTIADQQGGVIPKATVTLVNSSINFSREQKTTAAGNFSFDLVPPGNYVLVVEAVGFKKTEMPVEALIARPSDIGILKLQVGATAETITVNAENQAVMVNTQDSSLGANFVSSQITQLPLEARNPLSMLTLQAGVTKEGYVAGARSDQSNITLDGVNINDAQTNTIGSVTNASASATQGPVLRLNAEAVEEFRVNTVSANASGGRSSGAQVSIVTKSGTNTFHGAAFESHRNTIFSANDWFNNNNGIERPKLIRNTFGGMFSGPIIKDKLFFMYSYEGRRDASQIPAPVNYAPLPNLGQGIVNFTACAPADPTDLTAGCGGKIAGVQQIGPADIQAMFPDTGGVNPYALKVLGDAAARYKANDFSGTLGDNLNVAGYRFNATAPVWLNSHVLRIDFNPSANQQIFVRTQVQHDHDYSGSVNAPAYPDSTHPRTWSHPWGIAVGQTWTIHNNLISSFRYGMTRQAFKQFGDTSSNSSIFRYVYWPTNRVYDSARTTPVQNFVEDLSWIKGNHTVQFGGNVILVKNVSDRYATSFDNAVTNPTYYPSSIIYKAANEYLFQTRGYIVDSKTALEDAVTAVLGRYTQYTANYNYNHDGSIRQLGSVTHREFATQGYELYVQDTWKVKPNLTLTGGLRYSLWRPVYERNGMEVRPQIPLGEYFDRRVQAMNAGSAYLEPIVVDKSGPVNGGPPLYNWDKTVFLPKVAIAWQPKFENGFMSRLLGANGQTVIRGGFGISNDYFGQSIAAFFDRTTSLGFLSSYTTPANTFGVGCGPYVAAVSSKACRLSPGPLMTTVSGENIRSLPGVVVENSVTFPQEKPFLDYPSTIESSLDSNLTTPKNYVWSLTLEREMPKGGLLQLSYMGRAGRHLLAQRDVASPANLVDPQSGMDWYTAATILEKARQANTDPSYFASHPLPYFEHLFPGLPNSWGYPAGTPATQVVYEDAYYYWSNDWTDTMLDLEPESKIGPHAFFQPQYGALQVWSTVANSNYNALTASYRQRLKDVTVDVNYTYSHSLDDASGLQSNGTYSTSAFIQNPFRQRSNYAASDFDVRHQINVNAVIGLPVGRGKLFLSGLHGAAEAILGGWETSAIFRWNSGLPEYPPYDSSSWSTNFNVQSSVGMSGYVPPSGCPSRGGKGVAPNFFGSCGVETYYKYFHPSYPGDPGQRNYFRYPGYVNLDFGLAKTWKMPYKEGHALQFRWDTFNLTNTQRFTNVSGSKGSWSIDSYDPTTIQSGFGDFGEIQGSPRVMQFSLRYSF
jgi:hypothetical protein